MTQPRIILSPLGQSIGLVVEIGKSETSVVLTRDAALKLATQLIALAAVTPEVVQ